MSPEPDHKNVHKVFQSRTGKRRFVVLALRIAIITASILWTVDFISRVYNLPSMPKIEPPFDVVTAGFEETVLLDIPAPLCNATADNDSTVQRRIFAYLPYNDANALASLRNHCDQIDALLYQAFYFGASGGDITSFYDQINPPAIAGFLGADGSERSPMIYPVISPEVGLSVNDIEKMLANPISRNGFLNNVKNILHETTAYGVCLDLSQYSVIDGEILLSLLRAIKSDPGFGAAEICVIGGADAHFWETLGVVTNLDRAVVLAFRDDTMPSSPPASQDWFEAEFFRLANFIPPEKMVVSLGNFGKLWHSSSSSVTTISYSEAMWLTNRYQGELGFSTQYGNSYIRFLDQERQLNQIWLLDAITAHNQMLQFGPSQNLAIWTPGLEDPGLWPMLASNFEDGAFHKVLEQPVKLSEHLVITGNGPFLSLQSAASEGQRIKLVDGAEQDIAQQTYSSLPTPNTINRYGSSVGFGVVVTFNGHPDRESMAKILAVLDQFNIEATFFFTDLELLQNRAFISSIEARGHSIGTMLDTIAAPTPMSDFDRQLALNGMQQLLSHITGHRSVFIRDPSGHLFNPVSVNDLERLETVLNDGYLPVSAGVSSPHAPYTYDDFISDIRFAGLSQQTVVLSFDLSKSSFEDVVDNLYKLLENLESDGFEFMSLMDISGQSDAILMPNSLKRFASDIVAYAVLHFWFFNLTIVFTVLLIIAIVRAVIYLTLALTRRPYAGFDPEYTPPVTVLVPAFNEENVIERCLHAILNSDYPNLKVIVINDGSSDHTVLQILENFSGDKRVTILHQKNRGKWMAENNALAQVDTPIFIGVDADTIIDPKAVSWLVQQFKDERVGAVAGFVEVGNSHNFLTACQKLEYFVSQGVYRRAFEMFNGILVVPGAIGAWRTEAVGKAGFYSGNTITEDADLTISVLRSGYEVRFQEQARAITEAPSSVSAFLKQRLRWILGMMQTSWKHRKAIVEGRTVGYISIVDAIWFSMLTSLLSPIVDLLLIAIVVKAVISLLTSGTLAITGFPLVVVATYFILVGIDVINTIAAFKLERRFDIKMLLLVPLLRFGYRQLIYISALRAMNRAATGRLAGWNKLSRKGIEKISGLGAKKRGTKN